MIYLPKGKSCSYLVNLGIGACLFVTLSGTGSSRSWVQRTLGRNRILPLKLIFGPISGFGNKKIFFFIWATMEVLMKLKHGGNLRVVVEWGRTMCLKQDTSTLTSCCILFLLHFTFYRNWCAGHEDLNVRCEYPEVFQRIWLQVEPHESSTSRSSKEGIVAAIYRYSRASRYLHSHNYL